MDKINVFDYYSRFDVPTRLNGDILNSDLEPISYIGSTSKINLFVGVNNSGKSLLLRGIIKAKQYTNYPSSRIKEEINSFIKERIERIENILIANNFERISVNHQNYLVQGNLRNYFTPFNEDFHTIGEYVHKGLAELKRIFPWRPNTFRYNGLPGINKVLPDDIRSDINIVIEELSAYTHSLKELYSHDIPFTKIYIPTIRTLRKYDSAETLIQKTKKEYELDGSVMIQNGQKLFDSINKMITDEYSIRQQKKEFEYFLSNEFFSNQEVEITPNSNLNELTIKIGSEKEQPIYDLGEGIQMMIILTFPIFFHPSGIITIEEPETFLHPGYQHLLINTYLNHKKSKDFIFLISTHSNHILDSINYNDNISVFSLSKNLTNNKNGENPKFTLTQLSNPASGLLKTLGVRNTSVFLSNSTIWVEGITDMLYIRKYLEEYLKSINKKSEYFIAREYKEGIHYSFIFSGGSSIVHYDFSDEPAITSLKNKVVTRNICGKAFVLTDNDMNKNIGRKKKFFKELEGRFKVLQVVEIENLLSNQVIYSTIKTFPTCKKIEVDNSLFLEEDEYASLRLGSYIEDILLKDIKVKGRKKFKEYAKSDNSTINCKLDFCNKSLDYINISTMTKKSIDLVKELLQFIIEKNELPK